MQKQLLTSSEAADYVGVGVSTIKRWADEGHLAFQLTSGRHRRFLKSNVDLFVSSSQVTPELAPSEEQRWLQALLPNPDIHTVRSLLYALRTNSGSWARACTTLSGLFRLIGEQWESGQIDIFEERLCTAVVSGLVDEIMASMREPLGAPTALLATVYQDHHTLGLKFADLILRENGWKTFWLGDLLPANQLAKAIAAGQFSLMLVSATNGVVTQEAMSQTVEAIIGACSQHGTHLALGGSALWPPGSAGQKVKTLLELEALAHSQRFFVKPQ